VNRTDSTPTGKMLLDAKGIAAKVQSLADEIVEEFGKDLQTIAVIGIQTRGAYLARRVASLLQKAAGGEPVPVGILDITLYRDDIHAIGDQPEVKETDLPFDIEDRPLVLIDDVLFTGRTIRSAMNALIDYGRPRCIRLGVLIDRGHRELPIGADYVGLVINTDISDVVDVNLREIDEEESVRLRRGEKA
jgi:pyrimidine operon attenuation protein / uracil phosphoribosyltransferase